MSVYTEDDVEAAITAWFQTPAEGGRDNPYRAPMRAAIDAVAPGIAARALRDAADDYAVNLSAMSGRQIRQWLLDRADTIEGVA